ncbi:MAG: hypothetical protein HKN43_16670 [Rhodothermales bacterium]|nr:hypothetical protein [Rhodothermales bacterium]
MTMSDKNSGSQKSGSMTHVDGIVRDIRRRWRRRTILRGSMLSLMVFLLMSLVLVAVVSLVFVDRNYLILAGVSIIVVSAGFVFRFVVHPLRRQPDDAQIALFVEEKIPEYEDAFNSAVEVGDRLPDVGSRGVMVQRMIDDVVRKSRLMNPATVLDQRREQALIYVAGALFVGFLVFGYSVRDRIDLTGGGIELTSLVAQEEISILPGNAEVEKGTSQEIIVRSRDEISEGVTIAYREGESEWVMEDMIPGTMDDRIFLFELFNIQNPVDYFVEYGDERTDVFHLSLYEFPAVTGISITLDYPSYTGRPDAMDDGSGDISALEGTRAKISITTSGELTSAEMVFDDGRVMPLEQRSTGVFDTDLTVSEDGWYHFRLLDTAGKENRFPEEFRVRVEDDLPPTVVFADPGRDVRANSIQEILASVNVTDDIGIRDAQLRFSVNAGDEQSEWLIRDLGRTTTEASGEYLFFLEDYTLVPGDVISYYAEVRDHLDRDGTVATDMYFIEVVPFDKEYSQAQNAGGMPGRQGGIVFSQQEIIAATWKLHREWPELTSSEAETSRRGLIQAQANLKAEIEERLSNTAFSLELRADEDQQKIVEHLRASVSHMEEALEVLEESELQEAITPERAALNELLKADALNKEEQIALNRGGQGGQGGGVQDRISELMDLELDISRDKYETRQESNPQAGGGEEGVDDALNKVRELARKQEELQERSRENATEGEDKKRFVDQLKRDQDELQEQTEQLTQSLQQMSGESGQSERAQQQAQRISENMDRAERALREGNVEDAMNFQQRALSELEELQRMLENTAAQSARGQVDQLAKEFDAFRDQEKRLAEDIETVAERARTGQLSDISETLDDLQTKRQRMVENLDRLVENAEQVVESVREEEPELSAELQNILRQIERDGLEQNMLDSREALRQGWLEYAERKEEMIMRTVDDIETRRRALDFSLAPSEEERLSQSIEDTRDLRQQLQEIERLARERDENQNSSAAQGQAEGQGQGSQGDRQQRATEARLQQEIDRARQALDRLQQGAGGDAQAQRQIDQLQSFLRRADGTGVRLEGEAAEAYFNDRAYDPLSQLEELLERQLDVVILEKKLYGGRRSDVPGQYRDLVDKYYESLSKENN